MTITTPKTSAYLRRADGSVCSAPASNWFEPACRVDQRVLALADGPVLDVGCGPGRHALALAQNGLVSLGIDISSDAVLRARQRGATVLRRCVFDRVPLAGRWRTALLLDGNIGIGGDPARLLRRVASLISPDGQLLVEVQATSDNESTHAVQFEIEGRGGPWFAWTTVSRSEIEGVAATAGLVVQKTWHDGGRWFACLTA